MRIGNRKSGKGSQTFKEKLISFLKPSSYVDVLTARIVSPRLNIDLQSAKELGDNIINKLSSVKSLEDLYSAANELATVRFGEQFNIPINFKEIKKQLDSIMKPEDLGLIIEESMNVLPYGIIAVLGGPDSGKTSLVKFIAEHEDFCYITAMEPVTDSDESFIIGPTASCAALVSSLYLDEPNIIFDSARFVRGVSDYGLGEKGLPIGVSLFLTDINNLLVWAKKRLFLVVSTESNNESYNQAYYELLRGAVNGIIQPIAGAQAGYIEFKPKDRKPVLYKYGEGAKFETVENIFELKTNFILGDYKNEKSNN